MPEEKADRVLVEIRRKGTRVVYASEGGGNDRTSNPTIGAGVRNRAAMGKGGLVTSEALSVWPWRRKTGGEEKAIDSVLRHTAGGGKAAGGGRD